MRNGCGLGDFVATVLCLYVCIFVLLETFEENAFANAVLRAPSWVILVLWNDTVSCHGLSLSRKDPFVHKKEVGAVRASYYSDRVDRAWKINALFKGVRGDCCKEVWLAVVKLSHGHGRSVHSQEQHTAKGRFL
jgi:hypothetical protein